jgi:hypothetical protein
MRGVLHAVWHRWPHHTLYASKLIEAYGITLFLGLNDPRASRVRVPHAPAVYPIGTHQLIQLLMDDLSANTHLQLRMYHT